MRLIYSDARRASENIERELQAEYVPLEKLLKESDFVSLHVPLIQETHHLIGARELSLMKPTAVLINTSRGPVIDEKALVQALKSHRIFAAGLDVYENEPKLAAGLKNCENAVLAPHIASATGETRTRMALMAAENMILALKGQRPPNLVNPQAWTLRETAQV
jgi:glyoxylate reductase